MLTETGISCTTDGGTAWNSFPLQTYNQSSLSRCPSSPATLYMAGGSANKSTDEGLTWNSLYTGTISSELIACSPLDVNTVYDSNLFGNLYRSIDGGVTWKTFGTSRSADVYIYALVVSNDETIYVTGYDPTGFLKAGLYKISPSTGVWTLISPPAVPAWPGGPRSLAVSGTTLYYAPTAHLLKSTDAGATWTSLSNAPLTATIATSPLNPDLVYAITLAGEFQVSTDGGTTWSVAGTGLPADVDSNFPNTSPNPFIVPSGAVPKTAFVISPVGIKAFISKQQRLTAISPVLDSSELE